MPLSAPGPAASISVIIPCFNAARYIAASIRSVLEQHWPSLEIIVVDDGSTDGSAAQVRRDFPAVVVIEQPNQGVASARNRGIAAARGEWLAFLDADDIWLPGKLAAQMSSLAANPQAQLVYTAWAVWRSQDAEPSDDFLRDLASQADRVERWSGPSGWIYPQLLLDCEVWTSTVLLRRQLLEDIGVFDASLRIGEDYDLWLRASRATPILRVPRPLALYRQHVESITRAAPQENYRGLVVSRAIDRWGCEDQRAEPVRAADVRRALASSWRDFAEANLQAGSARHARLAAWRSLQIDPFHAGGWKTLAKSALGPLIAAREPGR